MPRRLPVLLACLLLCLSIARAQSSLRAEPILLTFIPNVQFAPFYVGIERGYFAEAGFELAVEHLQEPEVVDLVALGKANFGIVSGEQVILARAQGRDVVYVFEWFQQYPVGIAYDSALQLDSLEGLRGRRVGIPGRFGASYSGLTTLLRSAGMTEEDIEIHEIGFNAAEVFCLGAVDAAVVYVNNEPLQMRNLARAGECGDVRDVAVIPVASEVDLVSNGLIVGAELLASEPGLVERMVQGLGHALRHAINNPADAYLASLAHVDNLPADEALLAALEQAAEDQEALLAAQPDREAVARSREALASSLAGQFDAAGLTQFRVLLATIALWDADRLGYSDLDSWIAMRLTLASMGFLDDSESDLEVAFSNRFVAGELE